MLLDQIIQASHPGDAKEKGRLIKGFDEEVWVKHRFNIVIRGFYFKFTSNDDLRAFLLSTGTRVLVEASPRDRIWGIGMGEKNELAEQPTHWRGQNLLGFPLMEARALINSGKEPNDNI